MGIQFPYYAKSKYIFDLASARSSFHPSFDIGNIFCLQSIDLGVLKQLQEIFLTVFKHIDKPSHLKDLFQAVSTRLNYVSGISYELYDLN